MGVGVMRDLKWINRGESIDLNRVDPPAQKMFFFWNSWFHGPTPVHPAIRGFPETIGKKRKPKGPVRRPRVDHEEKSCHGMYWSTSSSGAGGLSRTRILTSFS